MTTRTVEVDVIVSATATSDIGECAHCGEVMQLRYSDDNNTMRIAHGGTECEWWKLGGRIYFARATAVHPETAVRIADASEAARRERHDDN